jgi:hypothetical protein
MRSLSFVLALVITVSLTLVAGLVHLQKAPEPSPDDPRARMAQPAAHTSQASFYGSRESAADPKVTAAYVECHAGPAEGFLHSADWTWAEKQTLPDGGLIAIGKKNLLHNFCISIESSRASCSTCHFSGGCS